MTSAEARAFVAEHQLAEHVARLVDEAPPLPAAAADLWRDAIRLTRPTRPENR